MKKVQPLGIQFAAGSVAISFFFRLSVGRSQFILAVANLCHPLFSVSLPALLFIYFFFVYVAYMRLVLTPLMRCVAYFRGCFLLVYFVCVCVVVFLFLGMGTASQSQHPGLIGIADRHIWPSNILAIETRAPHHLAPHVVEWVWPQQHAAVCAVMRSLPRTVPEMHASLVNNSTFYC